MHLHGNMHVQMAVSALSFLSWGTTFTALSGQAWAPEPAAEPRSEHRVPRWAVGQGPHVLKPVGNSTGTKRVQGRDVSHITGVVLPGSSRGGGVTNPAGGPTEMEAKRGIAWGQGCLLGPDDLDGTCRVEMTRSDR